MDRITSVSGTTSRTQGRRQPRFVIAVEKIWRHGERFAQVVGVAAIAYAAALVFVPELAPGLDGGALMTMNDMSV